MPIATNIINKKDTIAQFRKVSKNSSITDLSTALGAKFDIFGNKRPQDPVYKIRRYYYFLCLPCAAKWCTKNNLVLDQITEETFQFLFQVLPVQCFITCERKSHLKQIHNIETQGDYDGKYLFRAFFQWTKSNKKQLRTKKALAKKRKHQKNHEIETTDTDISRRISNINIIQAKQGPVVTENEFACYNDRCRGTIQCSPHIENSKSQTVYRPKSELVLKAEPELQEIDCYNKELIQSLTLKQLVNFKTRLCEQHFNCHKGNKCLKAHTIENILPKKRINAYPIAIMVTKNQKRHMKQINKMINESDRDSNTWGSCSDYADEL